MPVFLEAWALGTPVLTPEFDPDGIVRDRALGISAEGSWERLVEGARQFWSQRLDRKEMGERAHDYVREVHSIDAVGDAWSEVVESLSRRG
jgi:glycosyltransferase involved in cell wall biosynthesis